MSDMPKGTGSPEYDKAKFLIMQEYERLKYERLKKENQRLREALETKSKHVSGRDQHIQKRDAEVAELRAENAQLRGLLYKTTHTPFGKCNFDHLYEGNPCGECEACEHTNEVMKSVREALEGDDE